MKNPPFSYHRPATLDQALELLADIGDDSKIMSGGQSLLPVMAIRLSHPEHIIDISRIEGLSTIEVTDNGVRIGALVTHSEAEQSTVIANQVPLLSKAIPYIGHRAIRNRGTVCGSLAHADPAAELPAVALALGAQIEVTSAAGVRHVAAQDFFTGFLSTSTAEDELITAVRFPTASTKDATSVQELSRRHGDFALVGLACTVNAGADGIISEASLSFLGVSSTPVRAGQAERGLRGSPLNDMTIDVAIEAVRAELEPPNDNHASAAYRTHGAGVITKRALLDCTTQIGAFL